MTAKPARSRPSRTGPMPAAEARRRLGIQGMDPGDITRVMRLADASLDPVTDPALPRPYTDVYAVRVGGGGYTLGKVTGLPPG